MSGCSRGFLEGVRVDNALHQFKLLLVCGQEIAMDQKIVETLLNGIVRVVYVAVQNCQGVFPFYCTVFYSAHHEEMLGNLLVKGGSIPVARK